MEADRVKLTKYNTGNGMKNAITQVTYFVNGSVSSDIWGLLAQTGSGFFKFLTT